jgi:hypothetical protein
VNIQEFENFVNLAATDRRSYLTLVRMGIGYEETRVLIVNRRKVTMRAATDWIAMMQAITGLKLRDAP